LGETKLLVKVSTELRVKHYSEPTEQAYVNWIQPVRYSEVSQLFCKMKLSHGLKRFIVFHNKRHHIHCIILLQRIYYKMYMTSELFKNYLDIILLRRRWFILIF